MKQGEHRRGPDRKRNPDKAYWSAWALCGLLLAVEPLVHKHGEFAFEDWFGFHGLYSFLACLVLVAAARGLRVLLKRPEDYYDRP